MICFFWDLTSFRKSSMKSSELGGGVSFAIELLASSFLVVDEFCANTEFVAANAINIRVITGAFFWLTGFLPVEQTGFGHECCPLSSTLLVPNSIGSDPFLHTQV